MAPEPSEYGPRNRASLATARVVPVVLALIVAYAIYVVIGPLTVSYLLNDTPARIATGIAVPIVWLFLLIPVAATYARLLLVVYREPGYIPQGHNGLRAEPPRDFSGRDVFVCDAQGLPIWCTYCMNWKPDRAHHNQDVGRCTGKMDHFCPWVSSTLIPPMCSLEKIIIPREYHVDLCTCSNRGWSHREAVGRPFADH